MNKTTVSFNYQIFDPDGNLIEENLKDMPASIVLGEKQVFEPVEKSLSTLPIGHKSEVFVPFPIAYGPYNMSLVFEVKEEKFKKPPNIGDVFKVRIYKGDVKEMTVIDFKEGLYIIDGNHPLAGIDLVFKIEILDRRQLKAHKLKLGRINPEL